MWSWWRPGAVHSEAWPDASALRARAGGADGTVYEVATAVLSEIRKAKTEAKRSLRTGVDLLVVRGPQSTLDAATAAAGDLGDSGVVGEFRTEPSTATLSVEVSLASEAG